jgi:hypothetical protein
MENLIPTNLSEENIFKILYSLQNKYEQAYGTNINSLDTIPKKQVGQAISEFLDLVLFVSSADKKKYLLKRLLTLKSAEKLLNELENYLPLEFNRDLDTSTELSNTYYTPRLLKVTIKSLTVNNLSSDFISLIDSMFKHLLYFIQLDLTIEEVIYRLQIDIERTLIKINLVKTKSITLDLDYYL